MWTDRVMGRQMNAWALRETGVLKFHFPILRIAFHQLNLATCKITKADFQGSHTIIKCQPAVTYFNTIIGSQKLSSFLMFKVSIIFALYYYSVYYYFLCDGNLVFPNFLFRKNTATQKIPMHIFILVVEIFYIKDSTHGMKFTRLLEF